MDQDVKPATRSRSARKPIGVRARKSALISVRTGAIHIEVNHVYSDPLIIEQMEAAGVPFEPAYD